MKFGKVITESLGTVNEKRELFQRAFAITNSQEPLESIINMWAVATMLEDDWPTSQKVNAMRGVLRNSHINIEMLKT
jgi:hypothetical protein